MDVDEKQSEPTCKDIIERLDRSERKADFRDSRAGWLLLMAISAGFVASGVAYLLDSYGILIGVGFIGLMIGLLGIYFKWSLE